MFFEKVCMFFKKYICFLKKYVCFLKKYIFFEKAYIFFVRLLLVHRIEALLGLKKSQIRDIRQSSHNLRQVDVVSPACISYNQALSAMVITDANTTRFSTYCNARVINSGRQEKELTGGFIPIRLEVYKFGSVIIKFLT